MKFRLFVTNKKYNLLNKEYIKLDNRYEELKEAYDDMSDIAKNNFLEARKLEAENEKHKLNEISFDNEIKSLNQEIKLYEKTVKELEEEIEKLKKASEEIAKLWNDANRKLWCNNESARQLRKLSEDILASQRLDKSYLSSYIHNISLYVGGGIGVELKSKDK